MTHKLLGLIFGVVFSLSALAAPDNSDTQETSPQSVTWTQGSDVESFWLSYAESKGGLTWGRTSEYPDYDKVKEGDTLMVELKQGPCLMEFFHSRWRRANDVRRWDDSINSFGGCPYVFD